MFKLNRNFSSAEQRPRQKRTGAIFVNFILAVAASYFLVGTFNPARAQSVADQSSSLQQGVQIIQEPLGLPTADIRLIIARVIRVALTLLGLVMVALVLYGGYLWMTAGGNEEQIATAKQVLKNAAIGLAIILSAYAIVVFVIRLLGIGQGPPRGPGVGVPRTENFQGSGALGNLIKDHYPERNQTDVPRNTKIIITFRASIKPDSVANDTNKNGVFGDCVNIGPNMQWERDCDSLRLDANHISVVRADTGEPIRGANLIASEQNGEVTTVVIRPFDVLGSSANPVPYLVHIGPDVLRDDSTNGYPSIFANQNIGNNYYEWQFTCSTALDISAPFVQNVFPGVNATEAKNTVIQIDFSEAMDPSGLQGSFADTGGYFTLTGNTIFLKSGNSTRPLGNFELTNGYRTLEFTSTIECGRNACGGKIFCLPVCDRPGANCTQDTDDVLVRAARTFSATTFEAIPFSGAMDLSGNALDGNRDNQVQNASTTVRVFPDQQVPDNYFWKFTLRDELDITAPYIRQVAPGLDAEFVSPRDVWEATFSKRMRLDPMYTIGLEEKPTPAERGDNIPLCKVPRVWFNVDGTTRTRLEHCPFLDGRRQYYYPVLTSAIEDAHFNCLYPGKGPGGQVEVAARRTQSAVCDETGTNCCLVTSTPQTQAFCCNGAVSGQWGTPETCLTQLRKISP